MDNVSVLVAVFRTNPSDILLNKTLDSRWEFDFFPSRVTFATIILSNPSGEGVNLSLDFIGINTFASNNVSRPALVLLVIGITFLGILAISSFQDRKN